MTSPKEIGLEIRRLLLTLKDPNSNYVTDNLRKQALQAAGICSLETGEMMPWCACDWNENDLS